MLATVPLTRRGQDLRYVTAHFRDLQGLRLAPLWLTLLTLAEDRMTGCLSLSLLAWMTFAAAPVVLLWVYWSGRWYQRRYGIVLGPEPAPRSGPISIMNPEPRPSGPRNYGYTRGRSAFLLLLYAVWLLPAIFRGHGAPGAFAVMITMIQIVPRAYYPITDAWPIRLRRLLARAALFALCAAWIAFLFARVGPWFLLPTLITTLLLLDLYDHWLLDHLLSGRSMEWSCE